jgi:amidase
VRDTALVLDVLAGTPGGFAAAAAADPGRLRVAVSTAFPVGTVGRLKPEVRGALDGTAELLRSLGHEVSQRDLPRDPRDLVTVLGTMFRGLRDFAEEVERPRRLERRTRAMARPGALVSERSRERLLQAELRMAARIGAFFEHHDVLMTPVMSEPAVPAGLMEGRGATRTFLWESSWVPFEVMWNSTGQPAASVPAGFSDDGLPLAVQLVGRPGAEATLLSLAAQLEAARPWADRRPPVS